MDKKMNLQDAGSFENLLLDMMLSEKSETLNQTIDMNANSLFNNTETVAIPVAAKHNFIAQYPQFKAGWLSRMNVFRILTGLVATMMVVLYFVATNRPQPEPRQKGFIPIIENEDMPERSDSIPVKMEKIKQRSIETASTGESLSPRSVIDSALLSDSKSKPKNKKHKGTAISQAMPKQNSQKPGTFFDEDLARQITNWEVYERLEPEEYEPGLRKLYLDTRTYYRSSSSMVNIIEINDGIKKFKITQEKGIDSTQVEVSFKNKASKEPVTLTGFLSTKDLMDKNYKQYNCIVYSGKPFAERFESLEYFSDRTKIPDLPFQEFNNSFNKNEINLIPDKVTLPYAMRFWDIIDESYNIKIDKAEETFLHPFYISKEEVKNIEYREFVEWVLLYNGISKTTDAAEIPADAYNYPFSNLENEFTKSTGKHVINIYPKTDCWTSDFKYAYNEPLSQHYFTHAAYSNYPVVGVSYWQALAYLDWLSWIWQERCNQSGLNYKIDFDLPYDYERGLAVEKESATIQGQYNIALNTKRDLICNLAVKLITDHELRNQLNLYTRGQFIEPIYTSPTDHDNVYYSESTSIKCLDENVSEWCKEDYQDNFLPWRTAFRNLVKNSGKPSDLMLLQIEAYFNETCNTENGKLVRGANWLDRRVRADHIDLTDAMNAKAFIDPNAQHSTIGFRYVMRVKLKNEEQVKLKVKTLGWNAPKIEYPKFKELPNSILDHSKNNMDYKFYGQITETTNLAWWFFLNHLIDENRLDDLEICKPQNEDWAYMMITETEPQLKNSWLDMEEMLPFPKSFIRENKLVDFPVTRFAAKPVTYISRDAVMLYIDWLNTLYDESIEKITLKLPNDEEWMIMAGYIPGSDNKWAAETYPRNEAGCYTSNIFGSMIYDQIAFDAANFDAKNAKIERDKNAGRFDNEQRVPLFDSLIDGKMTYNQFTQTQNTGNPVIKTANLVNPKMQPAGTFAPHTHEIYDLAGNASEMIEEKSKTKGGSFASPACFINIYTEEYWNEEPSPCVGFRLIWVKYNI